MSFVKNTQITSALSVILNGNKLAIVNSFQFDANKLYEPSSSTDNANKPTELYVLQTHTHTHTLNPPTQTYTSTEERRNTETLIAPTQKHTNNIVIT